MHTKYRSLFWPILLIGVGVIWLLSNFNIIQPANLYSLLRFWPVLLIIAGLDLLIGRQWPWTGALLGLLLVGVIIFGLVAAPAVAIPQGTQWQTQAVQEPLNGATQASLNLHLSSQSTRLHSLTSTTDLLKGDISYLGRVEFNSSGEQNRALTLETINNTVGFSWNPPGQDMSWDLGLNSQVPWDLTIDGASGSGNLDLHDVQLSRFSLDQGSGSMEVRLGTSPNPYEAEFNVASGSLNLRVPENQSLTLTFDGGSGSINADLPGGSAIRVDSRDDGSGSLNVPNGLNRLSGEDDLGVWESNGYDQATYKIEIIIKNAGSGSINLD